MNDPGLTHLSISVDDVRAAAAKVVEHGGEIIEESDVGLALFVRDPDGQLLELLPADYRDRLPPKPVAPSHATCVKCGEYAATLTHAGRQGVSGGGWSR